MARGLKRLQSLACVTCAAIAMIPVHFHAQDAPAPVAFSFDVYGDSRSMMYLPHKADQEAEARKLMVDMFELSVPPELAAGMVQKYVKMTYDPTSKELVKMVMPYMTPSEVTTLNFDRGWVTEASVEDVKLLPGVSRTMYRAAGGAWVAREVVKDVQTGRAEFIVSTGDLVWWGKQADKPSESPYWRLVNEDVLKQLPHPDRRMKEAGLDGRVFPAVGNHEVWGDTDVEGLLTLFPYLKKFGVSDNKLIYKFDYQGVRFIFLWTGAYDEKEPSAWNATQPVYQEQMKQLRAWLEEARAKSIKKVFISFHNPAFASCGLGPIPEAQNPHKTIAAYARDLDIVVFNGHVHTTQLFQVDGVKYLLLGGGGAEQDPILPGRTHNKVPAGYPQDLYWNGKDPREEYNYLHVDVIPGQPTKLTLNRFRPWSAQPFEALQLFK